MRNSDGRGIGQGDVSLIYSIQPAGQQIIQGSEYGSIPSECARTEKWPRMVIATKCLVRGEMDERKACIFACASWFFSCSGTTRTSHTPSCQIQNTEHSERNGDVTLSSSPLLLSHLSLLSHSMHGRRIWRKTRDHGVTSACRCISGVYSQDNS